MATLSAAAEVLNITELVEMIMQHLSTQDLFRAQYISPKFLAIIRSRNDIQRAFFLQPQPGGCLRPVPAPVHANPKRVRWVRASGSVTSLSESSSSLEDESQPRRSTVAETSAAATHPASNTFANPPALNPYLELYFPKWSYYPNGNLIGLEVPLPMGSIFGAREASWRRMLLMQPPLDHVKIMDWNGRSCDTKNERGVTMGDVVDALFGIS